MVERGGCGVAVGAGGEVGADGGDDAGGDAGVSGGGEGEGPGGLVAGMSPAQKETVLAMVEAPERVVATEDQEMRLMRDIDSKWQLQAVMTEFWLNHFNVYLRKNEQEPYMLPAYEQETVLPHALGKFEDLLVATAKSPAMLMYLDNWESIGPDSVAAGNGWRRCRRLVRMGRLRRSCRRGSTRITGAS